MAMSRCKANLHFYDVAKHDSCPYCSRQDTKKIKQAAVEIDEVIETCLGDTVMLDSHKKTPPTAQKTSDLPQDADTCLGATVMMDSHKEMPPIAQKPLEIPLAAAQPPADIPPAAKQPSEERVPAEPLERQSLPTEPFTTKRTPTLTEKTPMPLQEKVSSMVAGWLVCIEGVERGKDYRIKVGINEIGRDMDSEVDIMIKGDNLISGRFHAEIQYDPEDNVFYLIQKKNEAVKINDAKVKRPTRLNPYDILQLGQTKLVFVPLCSEKFQWATSQ